MLEIKARLNKRLGKSKNPITKIDTNYLEKEARFNEQDK